MDHQLLPEIHISEKRRKKNQKFLRKMVEESDRSVEKRVKKLLKAGYSKKEIENLYSF